jgi:aspartyl-tRNA(Asn)/glutamyl-tRNA(Gln) amidotransferase subunit A
LPLPAARSGRPSEPRRPSALHAAAIPLGTIDQSTTPAFFTRWVNFLDLCGLAVPNGFTPSGLPLSLQIVCRGGDEAMALRIGWAWQNATNWHERVPPLAQ